LLQSVEPVFWPLVAVSILLGIGVGIGFVLPIIPGLMLLVIWSVVAPVTVLERVGVLAAFGRSGELVRGLLLHEGRSVIYVARQLGHDARLTLGTFGHVIDELDDAPRIDAEQAIADARMAVKG
jgi:hypothetical protein